MNVRVQSNDDPQRWGLDLVLPDARLSNMNGYPVFEGRIDHPARGYGALCGWIQLVKSADGEVPDTFEMDPLSVNRNLRTPFCYFGSKPTLFDAPARFERGDNDWTAQSFLCYLEDAGVTPNVKPLLAIQWGFDSTAESISLKKLSALSLRAWNDHLSLLRLKYPEWTFRAAENL